MYCSSSGVSGSDFACLARYSPSISSMVSACHSSLVTGTSEMWQVTSKKDKSLHVKYDEMWLKKEIKVESISSFVSACSWMKDERWVTPPGQTSSTGSFSWPARGSSRSWRSQTCQRSWEGSVSAGETLGNLDNWGEWESRRAEIFLLCRLQSHGSSLGQKLIKLKTDVILDTFQQGYYPRYNNHEGWAPQALSLLVKLHLCDHSTSLRREFIRETREKLVNYSTHKTRKRKHCTQSDPPRIDRPTSAHSPGTLV